MQMQLSENNKIMERTIESLKKEIRKVEEEIEEFRNKLEKQKEDELGGKNDDDSFEVENLIEEPNVEEINENQIKEELNITFADLNTQIEKKSNTLNKIVEENNQ